MSIKSMHSVSGSTRDPICCLLIENSLLYAWYFSRRSHDDLGCLVKLLNKELEKEVIMVKECESVEGRLRRRASKIYSKIDKEKRRKADKIKGDKSPLLHLPGRPYKSP